ncbi:MAG: HAMP domain-containing protein [Candidatus Thiodiazotropha sp. (ex Lucina aurantia)]|uniref:Oxygen sensor histidine kinase NreB n=1 Tax=Candidatus Thiodiazotropha endolucinida TaxID=1655433 RepID=A0A7Z1AHH8_9GAMM|nr:ATP-binding protein [Candidatus Thiodiazotropha endolucinida]MBT3013415.1 HAMP domain-containing protein [Candidatus Thiodiazotropha sp. (ex Lucina pensylvanica)]MBT3016583.1 HAMP domain-containing protein [Candidatus Thiodiazotropha taylori]MBT3040905.1 HAMP domain-containing protein [Candidatus Thiodiazotropha sp. (ex Codakia orbicularis)]MBV2104790.1 HAMP domain-containing protein [Candidatus Thiodiazotropha sp. (ex Lucina aurantia)]MBT3024267.1 HAMP domain-containing protein [Candidatus
MTLTHRLILLVIAIVMSMLASGAYYAIDATRDNISDEIKSSARLTMQLLTAALISGTAENQPAEQQILISHLQRLNDIRHLNIAVVRGDGTIIYPFSERQQARQLSVPGWYIDLVKPPPAEYRKRIASPLIGTSEIVILADPTDEIQDAWREARSIVLLIVSFTFLCIILMAIIIRRSLQPVNEISTGLGIIQSGDYAARLPHFNLPELNRLSQQFNHMAQVLDEQQRENRQLNKRLLSVQESERRHLSRELHDELGQSISAIKAMAVTLKLQTDGEPESADAIIGVCNHMYGVVRDMMNRLRPVALEELGMVTAIERLVDGWNDRQEECFCALTINSNFDGVDEDTAITLYRIVQEALTNVAKHAAAEKAEIRLERDANGLIALSIRDDGDGFDQSSRHKGMGLLGMRERVEALNGKISLASEPDQGVSIDIHLPFTQKTD